ncbi:MAG: pyridoxamine 5'-phosphate oxidase [Bacteriovoracaceae bacterium]|jgi:pyridoxamine 5'-phosphate oxidase|nr:pyridoxamine 5'-phosphate oxidase [Bacteriovoracaceae bacterium]
MNLKDIILEYHQKELTKQMLNECPYTELKSWMDDAIEKEVSYPNAATLATVDKDNTPSNRVILIKDISSSGVTFFTNYESQKGQDILNNPNVSISIFWKEFDRQIRIKGKATKTDRQTSEEYFNSRSPLSQVSAIISDQSQVVTKEKLHGDFEALKDTKAILECPNNWGGYRVNIDSIEFWQGRPNRLHDRFIYKKEKSNWKIDRLAP